MSKYAIGLQVIKKLCEEGVAANWHHSKLSQELFTYNEREAFNWVKDFVKKFHKMPKVETIIEKFPDFSSVTAIECSAHYVDLLENRYCYDVINEANTASQDILRKDDNAHEEALQVLIEAQKKIRNQKYRYKILDVGVEAKDLVTKQYNSLGLIDTPAIFGWPHLDDSSGKILAGDVVSFVGRPGAGKTYLSLWTAIKNWATTPKHVGTNTLFVAMEISTLPIAQRITSIYAGLPIDQLQRSAYSNTTYSHFLRSMKVLEKEKAKFYVIDGNLAASVEDIYILADLFECSVVVIDGAYLVRHPNLRLDRFTKVAENAELIKRYTSDKRAITFASWQFAKTATKKRKDNEEIGLEDIGYSDAIAQISSIVLGLLQAESVETMHKRDVRILKGRNGETGGFTINWDFNRMDFSEIIEEEQEAPLDWV